MCDNVITKNAEFKCPFHGTKPWIKEYKPCDFVGKTPMAIEKHIVDGCSSIGPFEHMKSGAKVMFKMLIHEHRVHIKEILQRKKEEREKELTSNKQRNGNNGCASNKQKKNVQ